jgi:small nuclear ribonucleoprotein (snRNP)-like protein
MSNLDNLCLRLEAVAAKLGGGGGGGGDGGGPAVQAWFAFHTESVEPFIAACNKIEGTKKLGAWSKAAFDHMGKVMQASEDCTKPGQPDFMKFVQPIVQVIQDSGSPDSRGETFNQEKAFNEIIQGLSWIMMDLTKPFIIGQLEAGDFYLNKVLVAAKSKEDPEKTAMREFVSTVKKMMNDMAVYAFQFHKTGVSWNFKGGQILQWTGPQKKEGGAGASDGKKKFLEERLEDVCKTLEAYAASGGSGGGGGDEEGDEPVRVTEWNAFYEKSVQPFIDACQNLPSTKEIGTKTADSFKHMGEVIKASAEYAKPDQTTLMKFLDPVVQIIQSSSNPDSRSESFAAEKSFAEIVQAHSWVMMDMTKPFIQGQLEAADFYLNKVLKTAKEKKDDEKKAMQEYVKTMKAMMGDLTVYASTHFKTGLEWKPKGKDLKELLAATIKAAPKAVGGAAAAISGGLANAIAKKAGGAAALKKKFVLPKRDGPKKEPKITVRNDKVFIENYGPEQKEPVVYKCELVDGKPKVGVFIGNCNKCVIKLEGKAKNITISGCKEAGIVFDTCVTTVEAINSQKCQLQATEACGTFMLDKCDRTKVYLPTSSCKDGNQALVYTTQSASTNIYYDKPDGEEMEEYGVPEQILHTFEIGKPPSTIVVIPDAE